VKTTIKLIFYIYSTKISGKYISYTRKMVRKCYIELLGYCRTPTVKWWVTVLCVSYHRCVTRINIGKSKNIPLLWNIFESMYKEGVSILWLKPISSKSTCVTIQVYITEYLFHSYIKGSFISCWITRKC